MTKIYWFGLGVLVVWRITHLLVIEDGPWNVMAGLRERLAKRLFGGLFDCFYCLSLWVAAPLAWVIGTATEERLLLWPALSAAAILLERVTSAAEVPTAHFFEEREKGDDDGLLRS